MELRFSRATPAQHELMFLLAVHRAGSVRVPLDPVLVPSVSLDQVPISRLLEEGLVRMAASGGEQRLSLTDQGKWRLRNLVIDYHLELMRLRQASDEFMLGRLRMLEQLGYHRVVLYGASETAQVLLEVAAGSAIQVLAIIDDDVGKQGTRLEGVPVIARDRLGEFPCDAVVVTTVAFEDVILQARGSELGGRGRLIGLFDDFALSSSRLQSPDTQEGTRST